MSDEKAWLVSAVGAIRTYGGNDGYVDDPESTYRWDSNVGNYRGPQEGAYIVVRNKYSSIGYSVIDSITKIYGEQKTLMSCRYCNNPEINYRSTWKDYRCSKCKQEFPTPNSKQVDVVKYVAGYEIAYVPLAGTFTTRELNNMCENSAGRESIREISWGDFSKAVTDRTGRPPLRVVGRRHDQIAGGHKEATVRIRNGQGLFRQKLLKEYGAVCAFSGPCPEEALDAAHLYSFATDSQHHEHGGLLLRTDLHRLFDSGVIAVDPKTNLLKLDGLDTYAIYSKLESAPLQVELKPQQKKWLQLHWNQYRG